MRFDISHADSRPKNLRLIVSVLALMALLSVAGGGLLYLSFLRKAAVSEADSLAKNRVRIVSRQLSDSLSENERPVRTLAGMPPVALALDNPGPDIMKDVNDLLDHFRDTLGADVCYLIDQSGTTAASSNRNAPDSFVGKNFGFRPYFQKAMKGESTTYLALGATSGKRGAYSSHPVRDLEGKAVGVAVIKASIELIESSLSLRPGEIVAAADQHGMVFISTRRQWLYKTLWELPEEDVLAISESKQYGKGPWPWTGMVRGEKPGVVELSGRSYFMHAEAVEHFPGWFAYYFQDPQAISQRISKAMLRITVAAALILGLMVGMLVFLLYTRALGEINRRITAEKALRVSEERYRVIYHSTPAMLHSINSRGDLVSVSEYWLKALGYEQEEVIGRPLTSFMTPESARYLKESVMPDFFRAGVCMDIPYQFVKKSGEIVEVLLSAIGERDEDGGIVRSLAVSVDVTRQKKAEEALRKAQEKLSDYSRDLERQVILRTEEISSILKYTPNQVYIKDLQGRFVLINPRYEEIFGIKNKDVRGKVQHECMPKEFADAFSESDRLVLDLKKSVRAEYTIHHDGEDHTYLSVKFPIYDHQGNIHAVGGISTDVTELKKAQQDLRSLSSKIIDSQEAERGAIARELHDQLGQILTVLRMDAVWIKNRLAEADPDASGRAEAMCWLVDQTIEDVRGIAQRLRPGVLDDLGLVDALEWYTSDFERRTGITCIFEQGIIPELSNRISTAAYRIAQEALTNVLRHASADRADVVLKYEAGVLSLAITDYGTGYEPDLVEESGSLGMAGMRERAMLAGGDLKIESAPGKGSTVFFRVKI